MEVKVEIINTACWPYNTNTWLAKRLQLTIAEKPYVKKKQ